MRITVIVTMSVFWSLCQAQTCDPFVPGAVCTTTIDVSLGQHDNIAVSPAGHATLHIIHKPPFSTCQASYTPGALSRSPDSAITGLLTSLSGLGFLAGNPTGEGQRASRAGSARRASTPAPGPPPPPNDDARSIQAQIDAISGEEQRLGPILAGNRTDYNAAVQTVNALWSQTDEDSVQSAIDPLRITLTNLVGNDPVSQAPLRPAPNIASLQAELDALNRSIGDYHRRYDVQGPSDWVTYINADIDTVEGVAARFQDFLNDLLKTRDSLKQRLAQLPAPHPLPYPVFTLQDITTPRFVNSNVAVSISCTDNISQSVTTTPVAFTAYFTRLPWLDFSAGPLFTLLGRHQVGVLPQTAAQAQATPPTNPNGTLGVTDQSSFQVVPMAFLEIHPRGRRCPWVKTGDQERRFGYVCTIGLALGAGANNATGSAEAEFFEGVSFGIQRVSFMVGFHDGRVEKIGGGYSEGQPVPAAGFTPAVLRYFSVRPAFSITYRIPIH
jgi:hypothetical protein